MKFQKIIKASLTQDQINYLKNNIKDILYDSSEFEDHYDLLNYLDEELKFKYGDNLPINEHDFQSITGLTFENYDKKMEESEKNKIIQDFNEAKDNDLDILNDALNKLQTSWANNKLSELIQNLQELQHDGSSDLGYRVEDILDRKHKRIM